jgi:hypothetical protein
VEGTDHWLAGSVPGWTGVSVTKAIYQSRYLSDSGRLFFNSPDHLVAAATTDKEKVYVYEPNGVGGCHGSSDCVGLISSGTSAHESAFLDASESGNDVFFLTADRLVPSQDGDGAFDIYDARVCEQGSPCLTPPEPPLPPCDETPEHLCKPVPPPPPAFEGPSTSAVGPGNVAKHETLAVKEEVKPKPPPKPLTRAQLFAKAMHACHKLKHHKVRVACEASARRRYGPKKHGKGAQHKPTHAASRGKAR